MEPDDLDGFADFEVLVGVCVSQVGPGPGQVDRTASSFAGFLAGRSLLRTQKNFRSRLEDSPPNLLSAFLFLLANDIA